MTRPIHLILPHRDKQLCKQVERLLESVLFDAAHSNQQHIDNGIDRKCSNLEIVFITAFTDIARDGSICYALSNGVVATLFSDFTTVMTDDMRSDYAYIHPESEDGQSIRDTCDEALIYKVFKVYSIGIIMYKSAKILNKPKAFYGWPVNFFVNWNFRFLVLNSYT